MAPSTASTPRRGLVRKSDALCEATQQAVSSHIADDMNVDMQDSPQTDDRWLRITLDYGTSNVSAAFIVLTPTSSPATHISLEEATFPSGKHIEPQVISLTYDSNDELDISWGKAATEAFLEGKVEAEDLLDLWKLALYKEHANSATVRRVLSQLEVHGLTIVDIISIHIRKVIARVKEEAGTSYTNMTTPGLKDMPIDLLISVPQMWEPPACQQMFAAASMVSEKLGIAAIKLVPEAECAAAAALQDLRTSVSTGYAISDELLVVDIGGGTTDTKAVRFGSDPNGGAKVVLESAGAGKGDLCGGASVNAEFCEHMKRRLASRFGSFKKFCKSMGLTEAACLKQAWFAFEKVKIEFTGTTKAARVEPVIIRGHGKQAEMTHVVKLSGIEMIKFHEPAFFKIKRCIERQRTTTTKAILVTGGFGRSQYIIEKLKQHFERVNVDSVPVLTNYGKARCDRAVSVGALLRWEAIEAKDFKRDASFGLATEEIFDETLHHDVLDDKWIHDDRYSGVRVVKDRWVPLSSQDEKLENVGERFVNEVWQYSIVPIDRKKLDIQIYFSKLSKDELQEHDAIRVGPKSSSDLKPGIEEWGPPLTIPLPDFDALNFRRIEVIRPRFVGEVYEFYWRIKLEGEGANVKFTWEMARPGSEPYDAECNLRSHTPATTASKVFSLCNEDFNPFPVSNF